MNTRVRNSTKFSYVQDKRVEILETIEEVNKLLTKDEMLVFLDTLLKDIISKKTMTEVFMENTDHESK